MKAIVIVHWPGRDTPACADHAVKLTHLASIMGFPVSSTITDSEIECSNCANEAKKEATA